MFYAHHAAVLSLKHHAQAGNAQAQRVWGGMLGIGGSSSKRRRGVGRASPLLEAELRRWLEAELRTPLPQERSAPLLYLGLPCLGQRAQATANALGRLEPDAGTAAIETDEFFELAVREVVFIQQCALKAFAWAARNRPEEFVVAGLAPGAAPASCEHLRDLQGLERIGAAFRCATLDDVHCGAWLPAWLARVCGFGRTHPAMAAAGLLAATMHVVRGRPSSAVGGVVAGSLRLARATAGACGPDSYAAEAVEMLKCLAEDISSETAQPMED